MALEYYRRGVSAVYFMTATPASPATVTSLGAAVNLSPQINGIDGFDYGSDPIDVDNLDTGDTYTIPGPRKVAGGTLTFNDKKAASGATSASFDPIRAALAQDAKGWLVFCPYGGVVGNRYEAWPVTVASFGDSYSMGNETAKWTAMFTVTGPPTRGLNLAA